MDPDLNTIRTPRELAEFWQFVDGGHGYTHPQLFAVHINADGTVLPNIIQMYDESVAPDDTLMPLLMRRHAEVIDELAPGGSVAMMKARPGGPSLTPHDGLWCQSLHRHLQAAPFPTWPLYIATDAGPSLVPADLLIAA